MKPNCSCDISSLFSPRKPSQEQPEDDYDGDSWDEDEDGSDSSSQQSEADADAGTPASPPKRAPRPRPKGRVAGVSVSGSFFFRRALHGFHTRCVHRLQQVPVRVRLCLEIFALLLVVLQLSTLVVLHASLMPAPLAHHTAGELAAELSAAVFPPELNVTDNENVPAEGSSHNAEPPQEEPALPRPLELLRIDIELDSSKRGFLEEYPWSRHMSPRRVRCEFASERALLEIPASARERAFTSAAGVNITLAMNRTVDSLSKSLPKSLLGLPIPGLVAAIVSRQVLAAFVWGPLHEEVRRQELAANRSAKEFASTGSFWDTGEAFASTNSSAEGSQGTGVVPARVRLAEVADRWSILSWAGAPGFRGEPKIGSEALMFVSCQGSTPASLDQLRRAAELLDRYFEWWVFKSVWAFSTGVLSLFPGIVASFAARSCLYCIYGLFVLPARRSLLSLSSGSPMSHLESLEAFVLILSAGALAAALCRSGSNFAFDVLAILFCHVVGELASFCLLKTQESRYIFPRAVLPAYVADIYYILFHPFGFTWLAHSTLVCYKTFLLLVLLGHFEAAAKLPKACPDPLTVEVRVKPRERPRVPRPGAPLQYSEAMQRLLLEQGLLLLGDDRSYEAGVVMSALVTRALQETKVRPTPPYRYPRGADSLLTPGQELPNVRARDLGGGHVASLLVNCANEGEPTTIALLAHILDRLPSAVARSQAPSLVLQKIRVLTAAEVEERDKQRAAAKSASRPEDPNTRTLRVVIPSDQWSAELESTLRAAAAAASSSSSMPRRRIVTDVPAAEKQED